MNLNITYLISIIVLLSSCSRGQTVVSFRIIENFDNNPILINVYRGQDSYLSNFKENKSNIIGIHNVGKLYGIKWIIKSDETLIIFNKMENLILNSDVVSNPNIVESCTEKSLGFIVAFKYIPTGDRIVLPDGTIIEYL